MADLCEDVGDEASWRAIFAGLCCQSVARLEKSWRRVDEALEGRVRAWAVGDVEVSTFNGLLEETRN